MEAPAANTLPKRERLHGKTGIDALLAKGRYGSVPDMRFIYRLDNGTGENRIMVSVPKKLFKRAVKRNLLKRRIRESYRRQKHILTHAAGIDMLFTYSTKEILSYDRIYASVGEILESINKSAARKAQSQIRTEDENRIE